WHQGAHRAGTARRRDSGAHGAAGHRGRAGARHQLRAAVRQPAARRGRRWPRPMTAITVDHLAKRYGSFTAVEDVSFGVPAGQVTALLGPNGAGKTTIIEILEGYLRPSGGQVRVLGADPFRGGRAWRARIGLVL